MAYELRQGNLARQTSTVPLSRYPKDDKGLNFQEWCNKKKPLLYGAQYFTEKKIGDNVYQPDESSAILINNFSSQLIRFGVWKIMAINKESLPNQENYLLYCFNQDAFLKGELAPYDVSCAAFINQHIRIFLDVLGDSYDQAQDWNTLVKGTNESNSVDLIEGYGHVRVTAVDNGTQSVLPAIEAKVVQDISVAPGLVLIEKADSASNLSLNVKITQTGIVLPTKYNTIDAGMQFYMLQHTPHFLFALYKADEPQRELIASKIYLFTLEQAVIVTDSQKDPSSVEINVVSKPGCIPYLC